jgi:hypothetical protein
VAASTGRRSAACSAVGLPVDADRRRPLGGGPAVLGDDAARDLRGASTGRSTHACTGSPSVVARWKYSDIDPVSNHVSPKTEVSSGGSRSMWMFPATVPPRKPSPAAVASSWMLPAASAERFLGVRHAPPTGRSPAHLPEGDVPVDGDVLRQAEDPSPMMLRWISSEPPAIDAEGIERARR